MIYAERAVILMYNPQLETFIRVADAGSFNKAAEELFISPPAVIKQINLLEAQLGLTLFVRTHRGLKLTEAGKSLYLDANSSPILGGLMAKVSGVLSRYKVSDDSV